MQERAKNGAKGPRQNMHMQGWLMISNALEGSVCPVYVRRLVSGVHVGNFASNT